MSDTGEDAIRRERESAEADEPQFEATLLRYYNLTWVPKQAGVFTRIDDADERTVIERTEAEQSAFAAKMAEWRRTGGIPSYTGPKAAR